MGILISTIFLMAFALCGWLAYQGVMQEEWAAAFVGIGCGLGTSLILSAELQENPTKFMIALFAVAASITLAYTITFGIV